MSTATEPGSFLADLQRLVKLLKADLLERSGEVAEVDAGLRTAHGTVAQGGRTAQAFEAWRDDYLDQVAVAWVLGILLLPGIGLFLFVAIEILARTRWRTGAFHCLFGSAYFRHGGRQNCLQLRDDLVLIEAWAACGFPEIAGQP